MDTESEGVIKFRLEHTDAPLPDGFETTSLRHWFGICRALDLIGQHPHKYLGAAYGNISQRLKQGFLVTGTQTGGKAALDETDITWVKSFDIASNRVVSQGPIRPSSESLTHGQLYALDPSVHFVIHVHSAMIWQQAGLLGLPMTAVDAAYGTPEMAGEVEHLMQREGVRRQGIFGMGGHEDGIVVFGHTPDQAGQRLLRAYRQACELNAP